MPYLHQLTLINQSTAKIINWWSTDQKYNWIDQVRYTKNYTYKFFQVSPSFIQQLLPHASVSSDQWWILIDLNEILFTFDWKHDYAGGPQTHTWKAVYMYCVCLTHGLWGMINSEPWWILIHCDTCSLTQLINIRQTTSCLSSII